MISNTQAYKNCLNYSNSYVELIDKLQADHLAAQQVVDALPAMEKLQSAVVDFTGFSISPWPVIISREVQAEFDHFIKHVGSILYRAIQLYFGNDTQGFSKYFGEPGILLDMLNNDGIDVQHLMSRHDVMLSAGVPKLLEANTGTTLGGWELNMLQERCVAAINGLSLDSDTELKSQQVLRNLFNYLSRGIAQLPCENKSGNIVFTYLDNEQSHGIDAVAGFLQALYESSPDYQQGRVIMTCDINQIDMDTDGTPTYSGERFNAILMPDSQDYEAMRMPLTGCMVSGHLIYPDCPLYTMASYKAVIGLCHDSKVKAALSDDEVRFVDRYIPFTVSLENDRVIYQGQTVDLQQLLLSNQNQFVIKKSDSLAGKDVVVGCFTDADDWQMQVEILQGNPHWVAQEYCPPDKILAAGQDSDVAVYDPVWGIFAVHNEYSGAFVRAVAEQKSTGVINSATGALEFVVLEEQGKPEVRTPEDYFGCLPEHISFATKSNTQFYSDVQLQMMAALSQQLQQDSGRSIRAQLHKPLDFKAPAFALHGLGHYPLNPWPVIISQKRVVQINHFTQRFDAILNKALPLYFNQFENPQQTFASYFNEPEILYELWQDNDINLAQLLVRYDAVFADGELCLIEINCGSALGGWEMEYTQPQMLSHVSSVIDPDTELRCRPFLSYLFNHLAKNIALLKCDGLTGNILFVSGEMPEAAITEFESDLQQVYGQVENYDKGRVVICTDSTEIVFHHNGAVSFNGEVVNAVIMPDMDANHTLAMNFTSSLISGHMVCSDSPLFSPFGSKAFMALLHEPSLLAQLDNEEQDFIRQAVPLTFKLDASDTEFAGKKISTGELLLREQQQFVIKKSNSSQGADVLIGRFMSEEDWQDSIDLLLGNGHWIAQQYCAPDSILSAELACIVNEYDPVWGIFAVEGEYAGAYVRTKPSGSGVINTACGAVMVTVMEEQAQLLSETDPTEADASPQPALLNKAQALDINSQYSESFAELSGDFASGFGHIDDVIEDYIDGLPGFVDPDMVLRLPLIISAQWVDQFKSLADWYPKVVENAIRTMCTNADEFSSALNESPLLYEMLSEVSVAGDELLMRFDLYHQQQQAKVLEVNVGTVCGGWDSDVVWHNRPEVLEQDLASLGKEPEYREICPGFVKAILQSILKIKGLEATGLILIGLSADNSGFNQELQDYLHTAFAHHIANSAGKHQVQFFNDMQDLQFCSDGKVLYLGSEVDALFVTSPAMSDQLNGEFNLSLTSAYAAGQLVLPDSPFHKLFGNKLLLALLHEYRLSGKASARDAELIIAFIPWSKQLNKLAAPGNGSLLRYIAENPHKFVLKKSKSSKGEQVFVGKNTPQEHWQQLLKDTLSDPDWLVQEYLCAPTVCVPATDKMLKTDLVWGVFSLAGQYSGNFVRIAPSQGAGVINSALGAKEMLVLEEPESQLQVQPSKEWIL